MVTTECKGCKECDLRSYCTREGTIKLKETDCEEKVVFFGLIKSNGQYWTHGKRAVVEPPRKRTATELVARVCHYYGCAPFPPLSQ